MFVSVSAGVTHSCGLRTDDAIECWGDNHFGKPQAPAGPFGLLDTPLGPSSAQSNYRNNAQTLGGGGRPSRSPAV